MRETPGMTTGAPGFRIGLMLYSVRGDCDRDFEGTLRAVASLGFEGVELFDLHGHDPALVAGWLAESSLEACGRHARLESIEEDLDELAAEAAALGWRRLVVSWIDPAELGDPGLPPRFASAAAVVAGHGLQLGFHNHAAELAPLASGRTFLDEVPEEVFLELDLGWAWYEGVDVSALLRARAGRCPLVHVKDFRGREASPPYCPVGDGGVGYETVAPEAVAAGAEWLLVEQDEPVATPLEDAGRSLAALRTMVGVAS
jgi:sugar phosphate isomerase/epimerase